MRRVSAGRPVVVDRAGCVAGHRGPRRPYDSRLVRVAFLLQDIQLSGGVGVVVEHASQLNRHHGFDARIVLTRSQEGPHWPYRGLRDVPVMTLDDARPERFDVVAATWWETASVLFQLQADRYVYFLQLLEDSTYAPDTPERLASALTTSLPVRFVTEARWIAATVAHLQPGNRALYVRNGIAKDVFRSPPHLQPTRADDPLRIVIEGSRRLPHKGVDDALDAVRLMREPRDVTLVTPHPGDAALDGVDRWVSGLTHQQMAVLLRERHVMLKLSRVEGMYGPPLEAFHMGATCVTTPVTGFDEYVRHAWNGVVVGWDDPHGTARALDLLARDRARLHHLRTNALATARAWPSWEQSTASRRRSRVRRDCASHRTSRPCCPRVSARSGQSVYSGRSSMTSGHRRRGNGHWRSAALTTVSAPPWGESATRCAD
jgi:glycosyltransferase involved in cell wall biosynthesis